MWVAMLAITATICSARASPPKASTKPLVDLDRIGPQAEGGVAGAEIIEGQAVTLAASHWCSSGSCRAWRMARARRRAEHRGRWLGPND